MNDRRTVGRIVIASKSVTHCALLYSNIYQKKVLSVVRLISRVGDSR